MLSDKELEESARKTLGLDEEPDKPTPQFYLESFRNFSKTSPYDTNFIIEFANPKKKNTELGGNGFGVITCMEDYCWKDIILSADPHKIDGGKQDGFGSFSDYQDHCNEPDHKRGRSERCNRLGIDDRILPKTTSSSSSSSSFSSRPPSSFELPSTSSSSSSSRKPASFEFPSSSSASSTRFGRKSILDEPALAGPSYSANMASSSKPSRAIPQSSPIRETFNLLDRKPKWASTSPPPRSAIDIKPSTSIQARAGPSSSTNRRGSSIEVITISSSSPVGSDNEFDELAEDTDEDDIIALDEDQIPDEYRKVTNKDNPIPLSDSDSDDGEITIKDRGKGKAVVRTNSKPLAPIFNLSQSTRNAKPEPKDAVEMVRDDSGESIGQKQKSYDAIFNVDTQNQNKGKSKDKESSRPGPSSKPGTIQALSAEEKMKLKREADTPTPTPPPAVPHNDVKPNLNAHNAPVNPMTKTAYYTAEFSFLRSAAVQMKCRTNPDLSLLVNSRIRILSLLMNGVGSREYLAPSFALLTALPELRYQGPPSLINQLNAARSQPIVNGLHNGYAGGNMPGAWNGQIPLPGGGMLPNGGDDDDETMADIYGRYEEWDRPRTDQALHTYFDENMKDFIEDITVEQSLERLNLVSLTDRLPDLKIELLPHQVLGVDFMLEKERNPKLLGGINADAMGLGKTVQSIATIVTNQSEDPKIKTTLIIAPLALLTQWKNEIESKTTAGLLKVLIYHGQKRIKSTNNLKKYDVVLTTYGTLVAEAGPKEKRAKKDGSDAEEEYTDLKKQGPLMKVQWYRVILDEAHQIRNKNTRATKACFALKSYLRWCLTGTPIVNTLDDVYPYLHFLSISPSAAWDHFRDHISRVQKRRPKLATKRMQAILLQCCIRRHKDSELNGKKLLELPPKNTNVVELRFTDDERQIYNAIENRFKVRFNSFLRRGTVMKNYSVVLVMLLRLRQLTCHPWLLRRNPNDGIHHDDMLVSDDDLLNGVEAVREDDEGEVARAMTLCGQEVVDRTKRVLAERAVNLDTAPADGDESSREVECTICYESPMEDERITPCAHSFCSTCISEHFNNPTMDHDLTDLDISHGRRKCPMCRGIIERGKIFRADAFRPQNERAEEEGVENDITAKFETKGDEDEYEEGDVKGKRKANGDATSRSSKRKRNEMPTTNCEDPLADVADELDMDRVPPSTKMERLGDLIHEITTDKDTKNDKIIVFSQFVQYIELCSLFLTRQGVDHVRYIGAMNQEERTDVLRKFEVNLKDDPKSPRVILMSLKCGGVGLNLCAANHVICLDLAWNAATENQAVDRAHRIGQSKAVHVHRLIIANTVEQRIMELQEKKQALSDGAMGEGGAGRLGRLSVRDLIRLFDVGGDGED
ncbi:uncharacterized protein L201_000140 [Kwoniella dendrophila CBS 6074]|uniref:DNA repair protein RAD5 n=1 Tax=Kwoniella dendrophila CBS 6074 TaxID=1295534 RepID=A0AAX4JK31_9TREE